MTEKSWDTTVTSLNKATERRLERSPAPAARDDEAFALLMTKTFTTMMQRQNDETNRVLKLYKERLDALERRAAASERQYLDLYQRHLQLLAER